LRKNCLTRQSIHFVRAAMETREKVLYHQIHPAKLLTDWGTLPIALYLLWQRR